jgi:hypothetical protein
MNPAVTHRLHISGLLHGKGREAVTRNGLVTPRVGLMSNGVKATRSLWGRGNRIELLSVVYLIRQLLPIPHSFPREPPVFRNDERGAWVEGGALNLGEPLRESESKT